MTSYELCSASSFLMMPAALAVCLVAFVTVGLVMTSLLWLAGWRVRPALLGLLVVGCSSAIGYAFFWIYLAGPEWGELATWVLVVIVAAYLIMTPTRLKVLELLRLPDLWIPLGLALFVGLFLTSITYFGVEDLPSRYSAGEVRFVEKQSGQVVCPTDDLNFVMRRLLLGGAPDYLIQREWVKRLSKGVSTWKLVLDKAARSTLADRPPLLAGIVLMFNSIVPDKYQFVYFMAMTSAASLVWVLAIWGLARTAGLTLVRTSALVAMIAFVYYFWFDTIFTWPKMLSGVLFIGGFILLFLDRGSDAQPVSLRPIILGASFAGLSYVTHFSTSLLLLGMVPLMLMPKKWLGVKHTIVAACVFLAIITPYMTFKSAHEGPSQLSKYGLARNLIKITPVDEYDAMTTFEALRRVYSTLTWQEIIQSRSRNVAEIFTPPCLLQCDGKDFKLSLEIESGAKGSFVASLKLFNLGWLILAPLLLIGSSRLGLPTYWNQIQVAARDCLLVALSGLFVYSLFTFGPVNNVATSGFMLLLVTASGIVLFSLPYQAIGLFSLLVISNFLWFAYQIFREDNLTLVYPLLVLAILVVIGLLAMLKAAAWIDRVNASLRQ